MKKKEELNLNNFAAIRQKFQNIEKNVEVKQPKEEPKVGKINQNPPLFKKETHFKQPPKKVGKLNKDLLKKMSEESPVKVEPKVEPKVGKLNPILQKNALNMNIFKPHQTPQKEPVKVGKLNIEALGGELNLFGDVNQLKKEQLEEIVQVDLKTNYTSCCFLCMDAPEVFEQLKKRSRVSPGELFNAVQKYISTLDKFQEMALMAFTTSQVGFILMRDRLCYIDWNSFICQEIISYKVPNNIKAHEELKKACKEYTEMNPQVPALASNEKIIQNVNAVITEYLESAVAPAQEKLKELKLNELKN